MIGLLLCTIPSVLFSQSHTEIAKNTNLHPAQRVEGGLSIDGNLDEKIWEQGEPVTGFRQFEPDEGAPASQRTEVRVVYGNGNVYIGAMLYDQNPQGIQRTLGRRDEYNQADWFLVSIDSYYNRRNAYSFGVNAAGVQLDALRSSSGEGDEDLPDGMDASWDAVWESAVAIHEEGWTVEMKIPNSMLRFPDSEVQTWGIHFTRRIPRLGEVSEWPLVPRARRTNLIAQFGRLTQIRDIQPRPNIQVRPYTLAGLDSRESAVNPGEATVSTNLDVGGDVKVGLGPNITLDATINPDFGQVESDPAVLNLTAFETFFDEKRPFFIEGIQIYQFPVGPGEMLYTRRIGAVDPIIGAAKLSGQTRGGTSFGILGATSGHAFEPAQSYGVARVRQQLGQVSETGAILTGYEAPAPDGIGRIQSTTGGVDWDIRFLDNRYGVEGFGAFTHRNFTGPGQGSETGVAGKVWFRKRQGDLNGFVGLDVFGDQFNPNDIGQFSQNNFIANLYSLEYQVNGGRSFGPVRRLDMSLFTIQQFSYDRGLNLGLDFELDSQWTLMNFQEVLLGITTEQPFGGYDLFETRGLGPWARPAMLQLRGEFITDRRRNWQLGHQAAYTWHEEGGRGYLLEIEGSWNIGTRLSLSGYLEGQWEEDVTAWVSNEAFRRTGPDWLIGERSVSPDQLDPGEYQALDNPALLNTIFAGVAPYADNTWYVPVFGSRDTRSLDLTLRSDVTFRPELSLQLYSQLFLARGRYDRFQIMQNQDELIAYPSYPKRSEFTLSNLQSNVVLRWEYRPGSNIYLVWTHARQLQESLNPLAPFGPSPYRRSIGGRIRDTFDIFPENSVMIKVEYTFLY